MNLETAVVLLTGRDDQCPFFGTGFVVHETSNTTLVLTCAHVVDDVGGKDKVLVGGKTARVVASGSTGADDLALLEVDDALEVPTFKMGHWGTEGFHFQIAGFQKFGDQFLSTTLSGNFGKKVNLQDKKFNKRVEAWELNISGNDFLREGHSGSPVIDRENGTVIAVVSHRHGDGKKGTAISINLLADIWPGIPGHLISSPEGISLGHGDQSEINKYVVIPNKALVRKSVTKPPKRLIEEITDKNVIPVVGAGLSIAAKMKDINNPVMPSYLELLDKLIDSAEEQGVTDHYISLLRSNLTIKDTEEVTSLLVKDKVLGEGRLHSELRKILNPLDDSMLSSPAHDILKILNFRQIITTNYDRLLEKFVAPRHEVITPKDKSAFGFFKDSLDKTSQEKFILKLHGDITRPETIFFGEEKLGDLYEANSKMQSFLDAVFSGKTFLFLGFSFESSSEGYVKLLERYLRKSNRSHYALVPFTTVDQSWRNNLSKETKIRFIEYEPDEVHSQVWEFLSFLNTAKRDEPKHGAEWLQWYRPEQRSDYLARQLNLEKKAKSIRILTPTLSNAIVNEKYLEDLCRSQYPDEKEVVNCMYARRDNLEAGLRDGKFDVRALFLRKSVDNDLITNCTENNIERYRYLISMVRDYGLDLKFRLISDMTVEQTKEKEFSFALIYSEEPKPHVDVATAYATQASTDFFSIHMIEINTDRVKRNSFEFERLWASAWSEKNSLNYIEKLLSGEK